MIGGQEPGGRRGGRQHEVGHGHDILAAFAPASSQQPLPRVPAVVQAQELHGLADDMRVGGQAKDGLEGRQEGAEATGLVLRLPRDLVHEALEVVEAIHRRHDIRARGASTRGGSRQRDRVPTLRTL